MKIAAGLVAALLAAALPAAAPADATLDRVLAKGVLVASTDPAYPPQSALNAENQFEGFDIDVVTEIATRMGVRVEFVTPSWDVLTAGRWAGRWDISVGSMTPTAERAKVLDFPAIYYFTPAALAVHRDNTTITSVEAASGKRIGVGVATTYEAYLGGNLVIDAAGVPPFSYRITGADVRTYETDLLALDELRLGDGTRLDAVVTALPTIQGAIASGYPLKVVGEALFLEPLAVATDKGDAAFDAKIAEIVAAMHADGTLSRLSQKWYGVDLTK